MKKDSKTCPQCACEFAYFDGSLWVCPECFYEWSGEEFESLENVQNQFKDINGTILENGDSVTTVGDLKLGKGVLKAGTKVKNIRLLEEPVNGHDISCKVPGHGSIYLKCSVVKKAK